MVDTKQMRPHSYLFLRAITFSVLAISCGTSSSSTETGVVDSSSPTSAFASPDSSIAEASSTTSESGDDPYVSDEEGYIEHEEEAAVYDAAIGRADLRLDSVLTGDSNGFQITASIASLDKSTIIGPVITVEPSDGVTLAALPAGCEAINTGYVCLLSSFDSGTLPHSSEPVTFELTVDPSAIDPQILVTATSEDNPVSNDPDPTNNTTTHILS